MAIGNHAAEARVINISNFLSSNSLLVVFPSLSCRSNTIGSLFHVDANLRYLLWLLFRRRCQFRTERIMNYGCDDYLFVRMKNSGTAARIGLQRDDGNSIGGNSQGIRLTVNNY